MSSAFCPPRFYPIIDTAVLAPTVFSPLRVAEEAVAAGVKILQYRHKERWTQDVFDEAKAIAGLCREADILFIVNDRADFAHLLGAGLHIGQHDLPPAAARRVIGNSILGFSTHNAEQMRLAVGAAVDYVSLGPLFATKSKENPDPIVGIESLRAWRPLTAQPLVAIGGITLENAADVFSAGADSVAIISGILPVEQDHMLLRRRMSEWSRI